MQPSPELENLIRRLYEKEASGGLVDYARRSFSHQEGVLFIGTDPNEYFGDYESIIRFYEANALGKGKSGGRPTVSRSGCRMAAKSLCVTLTYFTKRKMHGKSFTRIFPWLFPMKA